MGNYTLFKELSSVCNLATPQFMIEKDWRNFILGMPWHISSSPGCRLAETLRKLLNLSENSTYAKTTLRTACSHVPSVCTTHPVHLNLLCSIEYSYWAQNATRFTKLLI